MALGLNGTQSRIQFYLRKDGTCLQLLGYTYIGKFSEARIDTFERLFPLANEEHWTDWRPGKSSNLLI